MYVRGIIVGNIGSEDGTIHAWQTTSGQEVAVWNGHPAPVGVVQWSPKAMMVASGCSSLALWIPFNSLTSSKDESA